MTDEPAVLVWGCVNPKSAEPLEYATPTWVVNGWLAIDLGNDHLLLDGWTLFDGQ